MMKTKMILAGILITGVLCSTLCGCSFIQTQTTPTAAPTLPLTATPTPTQAEDSTDVTVADYDTTKVYTEPDYATLSLSSYVTLGKYTNLSCEIQESYVSVSDDEVTEAIQDILETAGKKEQITDRVTKWGDTIVFDYVGKLDGVAFQGGSASNQTVTLVENGTQFIEDFNNGLAGLMPGVPTDVSVVFPENYYEDLAGKTAVFTMTVHYILYYPELTDALATELSEGNVTTAEEFKRLVREDLRATKVHDESESAVWNSILTNAAVTVYPKDAVLYYFDGYYQQFHTQATLYGMTYDNFLAANGLTESYIMEYCKSMVKQNLVMYAVFEVLGFTSCEGDDYEKALDAFMELNYEALNESSDTQYTEAEARNFFTENYKTSVIQSYLFEQATAEILKTTTITYK